MPRKPKHPCGYPGCPNLVESGERYCEERAKAAAKQYEKYGRDPATRRRYGRAWKRIRDSYAASHPTTGAACQSPYVAMLQQFTKQANQTWFQIYEETERRRNEVISRIDEKMVRSRKIERFIRTLPEKFTEFDAGMWAALADGMTVNSKKDIAFHLTCGMDVTA